METADPIPTDRQVREFNRTLVLASGSKYRARMLAEAGFSAVVDPPDVDERACDHLLDEQGADGLALALARLKAADVARRYPDAVIIAGDQVGVVQAESGPGQLHKQPDESSAVEQLMTMSGTIHSLVNGLVVLDTAKGTSVEGVDTMRIAMRPFDESEARAYVRRFEPFDCSGSYRIEDQAEMSEKDRFITSVEGEHHSGVKGLPIPLLLRMLDELLT